MAYSPHSISADLDLAQYSIIKSAIGDSIDTMDGVMALLFLATAATLHQPSDAAGAAAAVSVHPGLDPISAALAASCRAGTYFNITSYTRMDTNVTLCDCCHSLCVECYGPSSEQCYSCNSTFLGGMEGESGAGGSGGLMVVDGGELVEDLTRNRVTCVAECPEGFQVDETSLECVRCRNFSLNGVCVSQCPGGYTGETGGNCTLVERMPSLPLPLGALVAIGVGGGVLLLAAVLCVCLCLCCCLGRKRKTTGKAKVYTHMEADEVKGELNSKSLGLLSEDTAAKLDLEGNPLHMHSLITSTNVLPLQKSLSSGNIRETNLSLPASPPQGLGRNTSYVQMTSAGSIRPSKSLGDIAEEIAEYDIYSIPGRKVASLLMASGTPSDSELLSHHTRPLALSDPLDNRRVNVTRPPPHSNPPSPHRSSPNAPLRSKRLAPPSPRHSCPNTPLSPKRLAPPSPCHSSPTAHLSSKKPALLPKPQHLQTGADEYVDPRVFQEDYEKSVESYVNKEAIQSLSYTSNSRSLETTYESLEGGELTEGRLHSNGSVVMQHPETKHESRRTEGRGTEPRGTGTGQTGGRSLELPGDGYENLTEFLEDPSDTTGGHSYAEVQEELQQQRYENIPSEGIYIQDDYTTVGEFLNSAGSSQGVKDMRDERRGSQDNQYVYMISQQPHPQEGGGSDITRPKTRHLSEPTKHHHKYANLEYATPLGEEGDYYTAVFGEEDKRSTLGPSVVQADTAKRGHKMHMAEPEFPARKDGSDKVMQNGGPVVGGEEEGEDHLYINVEHVEEEEQLYQNITISTH